MDGVGQGGLKRAILRDVGSSHKKLNDIKVMVGKRDGEGDKREPRLPAVSTRFIISSASTFRRS